MGHIGSANKVSTETARAFREGRPLRIGNAETDGKVYRLHGNIIAENDGVVMVSLRGRPGPLTHARLNAIAREFGYPLRFARHKRAPVVYHTENGAMIHVDERGWYMLDDLLHSLNGIAAAREGKT